MRKILIHVLAAGVMAAGAAVLAADGLATQPAGAGAGGAGKADVGADDRSNQAVDLMLKNIDAKTMLGVTPDKPKAKDPLNDLANGTSDIHHDLKNQKTDELVQEREKAVVSQLDVMIKMLEEQQKAGTGRGQGGNQGRRQSVIATGEAKIGDLQAAGGDAKSWKQLPDHQREQILQSRTEGFPAGYEGLLQGYYTRLAQEKVADEKAAAPAATQP